MANGNPWDVSNIIMGDRRGEYRAQGLQQLGQAGAQAMHAYQQNKFMAADATARFEGALSANPELQQILASDQAPPEAVKAYQKLQKDGTLNVREAAYLAQFTETYGAKKQEAMRLKLAQTQQQNEEQIMAARAHELARANRNSTAFRQMFEGQPTADDAMMYLNRRSPRTYANPGAAPSAMDAEAMLGRYAQAGGDDPQMAQLAIQLAGARNRGRGGMVFPSMGELEKRFPRSQYDYTMTVDPESGQVTVPSVSPRAPESNLPPGYEQDPAKPGAVRPIAGTKDDLERQKETEAAANRLNAEINRASVILNATNQVVPKVDAFTAGLGGTALNKIPGTEAKDVASVIDTIKANIGFEQLQAMRNASPTGGALGQVAVKELEFLQASLGNLSTAQSPEQLKKTLAEVQRHYQRWQMAAQGKDPDAGVANDVLKKYGIK